MDKKGRTKKRVFLSFPEYGKDGKEDEIMFRTMAVDGAYKAEDEQALKRKEEKLKKELESVRRENKRKLEALETELEDLLDKMDADVNREYVAEKEQYLRLRERVAELENEIVAADVRFGEVHLEKVGFDFANLVMTRMGVAAESSWPLTNQIQKFCLEFQRVVLEEYMEKCMKALKMDHAGFADFMYNMFDEGTVAAKAIFLTLTEPYMFDKDDLASKAVFDNYLRNNFETIVKPLLLDASDDLIDKLALDMSAPEMEDIISDIAEAVMLIIFYRRLNVPQISFDWDLEGLDYNPAEMISIGPQKSGQVALVAMPTLVAGNEDDPDILVKAVVILK